MTLHYYDIANFNWVENRYNTTAPINERDLGTKRDLRPIGDRARKWERIHKFSDNCYGLFDGDRGDPHGWSAHRYKSDEEAKKLCPILWTRHRDGTETVKVRNGTGSGAHNGRYSFLERYLPLELQFVIQNGKHFIHNRSRGTSYYLAKSRTVTKTEIEQMKASNGQYYWYKVENFTDRDDGVALTFRADSDGKFTYLGGGKDVPKPPRVVINKDKKQKYKAHINELWQYVCTVGPMLPVEDWNYMTEMRREIYHADDRHRAYYSRFEISEKLALDILKDYNHSLRLNIVAQYVSSSDIKSCQTDDDLKRVRAHFNRWINKHCGFAKTVK